MSWIERAVLRLSVAIFAENRQQLCVNEQLKQLNESHGQGPKEDETDMKDNVDAAKRRWRPRLSLTSTYPLFAGGRRVALLSLISIVSVELKLSQTSLDTASCISRRR